jgi:hypothetical protein
MTNAVLKSLFKPPRSMVALAALMAAATANPAYADITNDAEATGTYGAATITSNTDSEAVDVTNAAPAMTVSKSVTTAPSVGSGSNVTETDAGDTIVYGYIVTNTGNVTMNGVQPVDDAPLFNGVAGTGSFTTSFTPVSIAPGASAAFSATYQLSLLDVQRAADVANGVTNVTIAEGTPVSGGPTYNSPNSNTATTQIDGFGELLIAKVATLNDTAGGTNQAGSADIGETITYVYTITNTGTGTLSDVQVDDQHEGAGVALGVGGIRTETRTVDGPLGAGASPDVTADNGIWSTLATGATVTMTYTHTVTATEYNNQ